MHFIDPHIHMVSRTTNDYEAMREAGIVAIIEPAFWLGQARTNVGSFKDYYSSLVGWERFRASQFVIKHYCTIGLNSKVANNVAVAEEVMEILPQFLAKEGVVAVGEIGYDDQSAAEDKYFRAQLELAKEFDLPVMVHTPHRDKKNGTIKSMDVIEEHGIPPHMVVIDHNNEETVKSVLDRGYWTGFTIYPKTKMSKDRMVAVVKKYGSERIIVNSSADWGVSDPLSVPKTAALMAQEGVSAEDIHLTCYQNALSVYGQSGQFNEEDWKQNLIIDTADKHEGNTVLRGQETQQKSFKNN
jgi:predicted metal-dependent TIM-barrel fold hydrolase